MRTEGSYSRHRQPRSRTPSPGRGRDRTRSGSRDRYRNPSPEPHQKERTRDRHDTRTRNRSRSRSRNRDEKYEHRHRERSRSRSRSRRRRSQDRSERVKRSRSRSVSSASEEEKERRRKKKKHRRRSSRSMERKERKKEKKEKKKTHAHSTPHWGKYGIISETDMFTKTAEFHTWLIEERKINPEQLSKEQNKKEFMKFAEDYNTATLPHEKYYHIDAYERRMQALRSGEFLPPPEDHYDFDADMKALQSSHKKKSNEKETYLTKEDLMELRKVQKERVEASKMRLLGMDVRQGFGVRMEKVAAEENPLF